jgi:hypothetical protein
VTHYCFGLNTPSRTKREGCDIGHWGYTRPCGCSTRGSGQS